MRVLFVILFLISVTIFEPALKFSRLIFMPNLFANEYHGIVLAGCSWFVIMTSSPFFQSIAQDAIFIPSDVLWVKATSSS